MSLFQKTILRKYLNQQDQTKLADAWQKFQQHFHNPEIQENIRNSKEEQYQAGFLVDLFVKVLGYTINPSAGFNLSTEYKNEKDSKKADGALVFKEKVVAVIELKGTNTTDLSKIEAQAFGYKNNQPECDYIITSNFEKLRFYVDNAIHHLEFNLFKLSREEFELLHLCLHKRNIEAGIPKKMKSESIVEEEDVTKKLYKDYSLFKRVLFTNLCERNSQHDQLEVFKKTQKLLDRFLFVFFAEDRGLIPPYSVRRIVREWDTLKELDVDIPLLDRFRQFFGYFNSGYKGKEFEIYAYNGGLFAPDDFLDSIQIDDDLLYEHTVKLADYNFASEVDVNILGHIFENSLNEIDEIKAQIAGENIDKTKTKRKKDGVFYTPKYITKYIVDNTVGKLCEEQKALLKIDETEYITDKKRTKPTIKKLADKLIEYREWLLQLTICDPACGSGAFLNQALEFLIAEHRYVDELQAKLFGDALVLTDIENSILENNLFGVDLNEESVEIAKLSLWLRTAQPNRKLNNLNNNIKCGNSLIDDPAVAGEKAFSWEQEFPHVFAKGGFDVIIGNPPYVLIQPSNTTTEIIEYYKKYKVASYKIDLYHLFFEKSVMALNHNGRLGFITPNTYLNNKYVAKLRSYILEETKIESIINYEDAIFVDANVDVATIILSKNKQSDNQCCRIYHFKDTTLSFVKNVALADFNKGPDFIFNVSSHTKLSFTNVSPFGEIGETYFGIQAFDRNSSISYKIENDNYVPIIDGSEVNRYQYSLPSKYFNFISSNIKSGGDYNVYSKERIVIRQIGKFPIVGICEANILTSNTIYNLFIKPNLPFELKYVFLILNSSLLKYFWLAMYSDGKGLFPKIKGYQLKQLPIKNISLKAQQPFIEKADQMLHLNKELQQVNLKFLSLLQAELGLVDISKAMQKWYELSFTDFTKELKKKKLELSLAQKSEWMDFFEAEKKKATEFQQQITQTDQEIDRMVYALYELTEEEIKIVEGG